MAFGCRLTCVRAQRPCTPAAGYDWSEKFSSIAEQVNKLLDADLILDGEVIVQNERGISDFHELQKDIAGARTNRLLYMVFDVLYLDGVDLRQFRLSPAARYSCSCSQPHPALNVFA